MAKGKPFLVAKRRIYVLHSGLHTILSDPHKNIAAITLREGLLKRGVADRNIVVLENPYPTASWKNMFPVECLTIFADSARPESKVAQGAYVKMHQALQAVDVTANDELVWVGHSAGGQMGLTLAYLAMNLVKFPELAKETAAYRFDMVILLGAPVSANLLAPEIKVRHYYSPQDKVVRWAARYGPVMLRTIGYRVGIRVMPPNLDPNDRIRVFRDVEHPYWDVDKRVVDRIVAETNADYRPCWHAPFCTPRLDMSLMCLVSQALEETYNITFEEPPWK